MSLFDHLDVDDGVIILPRYFTVSMRRTFCGQPTAPQANVPTLMIGQEIVAVMCQRCRRTRIEDLPHVD